MTPRIDFRRYKKPLTLDEILRRANGRDHCKMYLRPDQRQEFYVLLQMHVAQTPLGPRVQPAAKWTGITVV